MRALLHAALVVLLLVCGARADNFSPPPLRISLNGGAQIAGNTTAYLGAAGSSVFTNATPFLINRAAVVTRFTVYTNAAPGAGNTFTYTLYRNGSAVSGATGSVTGAGVFTFSASPNTVLSDGDGVEIQVVSSSGAPAAIYRFYIEVQ